jgi:hypothetical protein
MKSLLETPGTTLLVFEEFVWLVGKFADTRGDTARRVFFVSFLFALLASRFCGNAPLSLSLDQNNIFSFSWLLVVRSEENANTLMRFFLFFFADFSSNTA